MNGELFIRLTVDPTMVRNAIDEAIMKIRSGIGSELVGQSDFKPGDGVAVKAGGPPMFVVDVGATTGVVFCSWHAGAGWRQIAPFDADKLTRLQEADAR